MRFVLVDHPTRGRVILMSTDLTLMPLMLIAGYSYRFKLEASFRQALYTLGTLCVSLLDDADDATRTPQR